MRYWTAGAWIKPEASYLLIWTWNLGIGIKIFIPLATDTLWILEMNWNTHRWVYKIYKKSYWLIYQNLPPQRDEISVHSGTLTKMSRYSHSLLNFSQATSVMIIGILPFYVILHDTPVCVSLVLNFIFKIGYLFI